MKSKSKRCVLLVVDALSQTICDRLIRDGQLPSMGKLVDQGGRLDRCLSIFPSITPAATCSIITGCYPAEHGIEGAYWLDRSRDEVAYFGDDLALAFQRGLHAYLVDFGDRLNFERLSRPTLFEQLHELGVESACINYMWFAGPHEHRRETPLALRISVGKLDPTVRGPKFLKLGSFVEELPEGVPAQPKPTILGRYGFDDSTTGSCLLAMAEHDCLPPMTVGYFPDNDHQSHKVGPEQAAQTTLTEFDRFLGEFVEKLGGWDEIGESVDLVIVGDHSQLEFSDDGPKALMLDETLKDFQQADPGDGWQADDQLLICPNMRAAGIYLRRPDDRELLGQVVERLLREKAVDQVIHEAGENSVCVRTADRGTLTFRRAQDEASANLQDDYGNDWWFEGELACVDASRDDENRLVEGCYPNPLERLERSFVPASSPIWVTAQTGAEFRIAEISSHPGGSHGALSREDSEAGLLTSRGIRFDAIANPARPRIVDVVNLCRANLGLEPINMVAAQSPSA